MRPSCLDCARKHLAKASVLEAEARLGYPDYKWLVIANLSEAEEELLDQWEVLAMEIRSHRKAYETGMDYSLPIMDLIRRLSEEEEKMLGSGM